MHMYFQFILTHSLGVLTP